MAEVTVIANLPVLGLRKNQKVTVELTDLIQGAIDGGKLSRVEPEPVVVADPPKPREGRARGERADHDAPGSDS